MNPWYIQHWLSKDPFLFIDVDSVDEGIFTEEPGAVDIASRKNNF